MPVIVKAGDNYFMRCTLELLSMQVIVQDEACIDENVTNWVFLQLFQRSFEKSLIYGFCN